MFGWQVGAVRGHTIVGIEGGVHGRVCVLLEVAPLLEHVSAVERHGQQPPTHQVRCHEQRDTHVECELPDCLFKVPLLAAVAEEKGFATIWTDGPAATPTAGSCDRSRLEVDTVSVD